jgi:release factor glutamine methyltransferase
VKTVIEILKLSTAFLEKQGIESPRKSAEEVIADALGFTRMRLYLEHDRPLNEEELDLIRARLKRRAAGEPAAYIRGEVEFYGCDIQVTQAVLIPRQETEILADKMAEWLRFIPLKGKRFLDLCCGSGCLGIAMKRKFPDLTVILSDYSHEALEVAKANALKNEVAIEFLEGDLLEPLKNGKVDFVVCNPPYISEEEYASLSPEVKNFEPKLALVGGQDGLQFYRRLREALPLHLYPSGRVWLEIGANQGADVLKLFSGPIWKSVRIEKDWAGHDRFISLEIE